MLRTIHIYMHTYRVHRLVRGEQLSLWARRLDRPHAEALRGVLAPVSHTMHGPMRALGVCIWDDAGGYVCVYHTQCMAP